MNRNTLERRIAYGGKKGRAARRRLERADLFETRCKNRILWNPRGWSHRDNHARTWTDVQRFIAQCDFPLTIVIVK